MNRPQVALVIDDALEVPPKNGVTSRFLNVAKRLTGTDYITCVIADRGGADPSELRRVGIHGFVVPADWLYRDNHYPKILSLFKNIGINVLHVCNAHTMVPRYGLKLAHDLRSYLVVDMHDVNSDLVDAANADLRTIENRQQIFVAQHSDSVCVMSSNDIGRLVTLGVSQHKLFYSPNGIERVNARVKTGNTKRVVFLGNLFYPPNMEAAQLIADEISVNVRTPGAEFSIVGPCPVSAHGRIKRHNVEILGAQEDLSPILSRATVAIAPLRTGSGMKTKILEYAAHQLPVVCTAIAASGYQKTAGLIVREKVQDICFEIDKLLQTPARARTLGRALAESSYEQFNWDSVTRDLLEHYATLFRRDALAKPRIEAPDSDQFEHNGIIFPSPIHLLEERYQSARSKMARTILEI